MTQVQLNTIQANGVNVFYRSAGPPTAPVLLLLHGFPASSFQFRELIPLLASKFRVLAPDLPGFGFTEVPAERNYRYTFDSLAVTIESFLDALNVRKFAVYIFDYGVRTLSLSLSLLPLCPRIEPFMNADSKTAPQKIKLIKYMLLQAPTAFRIAERHSDRVTAIISQNGNAYLEGLGKNFWAPLEAYWAEPTFSTTSPQAQALLPFLQLGPTKWQYTNGVPEALQSRIAPETYTLDAALLTRESAVEVQLSLFYDYRTNLQAYPRWQEYLRTSGVPVLALWGANDDIFIKAGAEAFARDVKDLVLEFVDSGHFALETHVEYYAEQIDKFLSARILKA
jgi:pimeloyl-ACP methyl ester carboxylesterase